MPAKLYSHALELAAIKSMTSGNERLANRIFSRVNEDFFSMEHTAEAFRRIQNLARKHGDLPRWNNLMEDMVISQDSRDELDSREVDPVANKREAEDLILGLDKYRKTRSLWRTTRKIQEKLKGESIDLDQLTEEMADVLNSTRGSTDMADHTTLIGGKNPDMGILREVLTNTENEFIPTGFKHFDRENQGVPRGSVFVIAATTGSGKCLHFDEQIVSSEGNIKIGSVWDSFNTPVNEDGFKPADRDLFVVSDNLKKKRVLAAYKTRGKHIRVTFSNGSTVKGLPQHKIWILDSNDEPRYRRLDAIQPGDRTIVHNVENYSSIIDK
jgi:predicted transcriptional regulator